MNPLKLFSAVRDLSRLIEEANRIAEEMGADAPVGTAQVVTG